MKKVRTCMAAALGAVCLVAAGISVALYEPRPQFAEAASHTVEISMNDFDGTSYVYRTTAEAGNSVSYSYAEGKSLSLAGKDGVALRVKNLSSSDYSLFQLYVYAEGSQLVYSPYNMTATFYWMSGGVSTTKHATAPRYVLVPASFDGWMFLDFTQMVAVRTSQGAWDWKTTTWLSAEGQGDNALPTCNSAQFGYFSAASANGRELLIGEHTTYTKDEAGACVPDEVRATADLSTAETAASEYELAEVGYASRLTCNFASADDYVTFASPSASVPYGYALTVPARFAAGYTQGTVTLGTGEEAQTQTSLSVANIYMEDTTLEVTVASRAIALDASARVLDPDDASATGANYGGAYKLAASVSGVGADGVFVRVRNTLDKVYQINTLYVNGENGVQYSLLNSLVTYVWLDGEVTTDRPASGATVKNRSANIPALFDGYMVIPFSELVATHVDNNISASSDWNKFEADKLLENTSDPWRSYPKADIIGINIYFTRGGGNEGVNELILGDFGTYTGEAAQFVNMQTSAFDPSVSSLTANGGLVTIDAYPETTLSVRLKIDGIAAVSSGAIDLGTDSTEHSLTYGEALSLSPETALGYALARIEYSGAATGTLEDASYVNLIKEGGELEINFVTEETAQVTVAEGSVSLADKAGIKVVVNNAEGDPIDWQLILTDGERQYTASSKGAGLIAEGDAVVFGNVFSVPAGFVGTLYIPFNVWRGSTYGAMQYLPFDYGEGEKPVSVTGKIYLNVTSGQDKQALAQIFSGWEYVTALPEPTKADLANADLYEEGDADLVGGVSVDPMEQSTATNAGQARPIKITPQQTVSFESAGIAIRVRNFSEQAFGWRIYAYTSDGKVYVPQASNDYTLIYADGTTETLTDTNRNMIIPVGFDGTVVAHFADFATDNAAADLGQNVVRDGLTVNYFNLYSSGVSGGVLIGGAVLIAYDGSVEALPLGLGAISDPNVGTQYESRGFRLTEISAAEITVTGDVTLSRDFAIFGTTAVTLMPAAGKLIADVSVPDGCTAQKNADGTYTVTISRPLSAQETQYALGAQTVNAIVVTVAADENGTVRYGDAEVDGSVVVPETESWYLTAQADPGYAATVTADGVPIAADENGYLIPAGTEEIVVSFDVLTAEIAVEVSGNGAVTLDGRKPGERETLEQGRTYVLLVVPDKGYTETVMLNGKTLTAEEGGYEIVVYEDGTLAVTFAPEQYTITYDLDRGVNGNNPSSYTVNDAVTFEAPSKEGYNFLYWYVTDESGKEVQITGIEAGSVGDLTVHAKFELIESDEDPDNEPEEGCAGCGTVGFGGWGGGIGLGILAGAAVLAMTLGRKRCEK